MHFYRLQHFTKTLSSFAWAAKLILRRPPYWQYSDRIQRYFLWSPVARFLIKRWSHSVTIYEKRSEATKLSFSLFIGTAVVKDLTLNHLVSSWRKINFFTCSPMWYLFQYNLENVGLPQLNFSWLLRDHNNARPYAAIRGTCIHWRWVRNSLWHFHIAFSDRVRQCKQIRRLNLLQTCSIKERKLYLCYGFGTNLCL